MEKFNAKELAILREIFYEHFGPGALYGIESDDITRAMNAAFMAGKKCIEEKLSLCSWCDKSYLRTPTGS